jgi:hypothetical protein
MAQVGRIETAAKKSDTLAAGCCLIHSLILIRRVQRRALQQHLT